MTKHNNVSLSDLLKQLKPKIKYVNISRPGTKYIQVADIRKAWSECLKLYD